MYRIKIKKEFVKDLKTIYQAPSEKIGCKNTEQITKNRILNIQVTIQLLNNFNVSSIINF